MRYKLTRELKPIEKFYSGSIHISLASFCWTYVNSTDPDRISHNEVSDQGIHFLLAECSIKRGTYICAHAWIFLQICILMTHYIQTMKMYLLN